MTAELGEYLRVHQVRRKIEIRDRMFVTFIEPASLGVEVDRLEQRTRPHGDRFSRLQHLLLQLLRPASGRLAQFAGEQRDDRFRKRDVGIGIEHVLDGRVRGHHHQGHVTDDLRRRRHLDDVTERHVDIGVCARDLGPAAGQP